MWLMDLDNLNCIELQKTQTTFLMEQTSVNRDVTYFLMAKKRQLKRNISLGEFLQKFFENQKSLFKIS